MSENCIRVSCAFRYAGHVNLISILQIQYLISVRKPRPRRTDVIGVISANAKCMTVRIPRKVRSRKRQGNDIRNEKICLSQFEIPVPKVNDEFVHRRIMPYRRLDHRDRSFESDRTGSGEWRNHQPWLRPIPRRRRIRERQQLHSYRIRSPLPQKQEFRTAEQPQHQRPLPEWRMPKAFLPCTGFHNGLRIPSKNKRRRNRPPARNFYSQLRIPSYSSSSFTSPRSALAFSIIFSCCCPGTTS